MPISEGNLWIGASKLVLPMVLSEPAALFFLAITKVARQSLLKNTQCLKTLLQFVLSSEVFIQQDPHFELHA